MTSDGKPWGRLATLVLGIIALVAGQMAALSAVVWWQHGLGYSRLTDFSSDGVAVTLSIVASTPIQVALLALFAKCRDGMTNYLGLKLPHANEVIFGSAAIATFIIAGDALSWFLGRGIITSFQSDIYRTANDAGWLPWLLLVVVVLTPIGEETLFRGFLFPGWLRSPRDAWPVIVVTALLWALIHLQYDWYVISQVFAFGLLLGWLRWHTGSTILTILLHGVINLEGMLETYFSVS